MEEKQYELKVNTNRGDEWAIFAMEVLDHVQNYSVKQYGDLPNDAVASFTCEQIISSIERYCARFGKNAREGQDQLDLKKIAHYAAILSNKIKNVEPSKKSIERTYEDVESALEWLNNDVLIDPDVDYEVHIKLVEK